MNTRKQVLIMSALLSIMLVIVGIYAAWYPSRADSASEEFDNLTTERAAILFARNCRLCHGDAAEGGALGARLPAAPALNRADLQGFVDSKATTSSDANATAGTLAVSNGGAFKNGQTILVDEERMTVSGINGNNLTVSRAIGHTEAASHPSGSTVQIQDAALLKDKVKLITNTVTCGRVGTAMPAWGQTQGGPLSDEQIRQLSVLITQARWDLVHTEVNVEDLKATKLLDDMSDTTTSMKVSDVSVFTEKDAIRIGDERLRVGPVPKVAAGTKDKSGVISVTRGVLGTTPLEHAAGDPIYAFPETAEPAINQSSCGQTAQAPRPAGTPVTIPDPFDGQSVTVVAQNVAFDQKTITVKAGGKLRVRLDNKDTGVDHDIAFYKSATDTTPVSTGSVGVTFAGPAQGDISFDVPAAGTYYFRCDVHPTIMTGTFTVTP